MSTIKNCTFETSERSALLEIWKIVHTPTKDTGHRSPNSHFGADFDAIRKIIKPFVGDDDEKRNS